MLAPRSPPQPASTASVRIASRLAAMSPPVRGDAEGEWYRTAAAWAIPGPTPAPGSRSVVVRLGHTATGEGRLLTAMGAVRVRGSSYSDGGSGPGLFTTPSPGLFIGCLPRLSTTEAQRDRHGEQTTRCSLRECLCA